MTKLQDLCLKALKGEEIPTRIELDEPFINENGVIQNLWLGQNGGVAIISSKAKTIRANHYHTDFHLSYVVSGWVEYYEREIGDLSIPKPMLFMAGEAFYSPPNKEHAMVFYDPTVFITINGNTRTHQIHEDNVKRVEFIKAEDVFETE